jgi:hypothetical protein
MRPFKNFRTFERDLGNFVKKMSQHWMVIEDGIDSNINKYHLFD